MLDFEDGEPQNIKDSKPATIFGHRYRYFILLLGMFCLASISSNMHTINFTFICMIRAPNDTLPRNISAPPEYYYNQQQKSYIMWAAAIGSMAATFPFSYLYTKFGARYVFFSAGVISTVSTLLVPLAAETGLIWFLILRVFQGAAFAADFAAIGVLTSRWASLKQNAIFLSVLTCFTPLSLSFTNPISGILCESSFGWPAVYYFHGAASCVLFALWLTFYSDHPSRHSSVSPIELEKIHRNKSEAHINMDPFLPVKEICKNPVILTVWFNAFIDLVSAIFLLTYIPTYINRVLHYGVAHTGWLAALPTIAHIPCKLFCGYLSDNIKCVTERTKLIIFNSLALVVPGILFLVVGYLPDETPLLTVIMFASINAFIGANCSGFYKCGSLVSRQFSAFVIANIQFIKCVTLFVAPLLVALFVTNDEDKTQWRIIFLIFGVANFIANGVFCYMVTDEPATFTQLTKKASIQQKQ